MIAIPASEGPQVPRSDWPTDEPTKPANILAITPIEPPFLVIAPAARPVSYTHLDVYKRQLIGKGWT